MHDEVRQNQLEPLAICKHPFSPLSGSWLLSPSLFHDVNCNLVFDSLKLWIDFIRAYGWRHNFFHMLQEHGQQVGRGRHSSDTTHFRLLEMFHPSFGSAW